ncbi:hemicentin-1-like isoform X2 [Ornithodoros turicata]|uniref:hemicentin-1-like isoform X2 n=1 Tax=Ornithodoros turicata TaxID=34597 RepID=UPI0031390D74
MPTSLLCWWTFVGAVVRLLMDDLVLGGSAEGIIGREHNVSGFVGQWAVLPCEVDEASCGRVYFITWTKNVSEDWERVYLFSETVNRVMGPLSEPQRATFHPGNASAHLRIQPLSVEDEGTYKCDVTYVQGKCPSLSFTRLQTLVTPKEPVIKMDGKQLTNGTTLGPYLEGSTVVLDCVSSGGRPAPQVLWRNSSVKLPVKTSIMPDLRGIHDVTSTARFVLSRYDLGAKLECVVVTKATAAPVVKWVKLDVHVRPLALRLRGPNYPVVAGEMVSLTCIVEGARPAANITWYNRSEMARAQPPPSTEAMSDGTYRTSSTLVFVASLYDHQADFFCKGTNQVLKNRTEVPLLQAVRLEVLYPPAVQVLPIDGVNVTETHPCNLTCRYNSNPPNVTEVVWYRNGDILPRNERYHTALLHKPDTLHIRNTTRSDSGVYSCHAKNAFGRGNSSNSIYVDVFYTPLVSIWINPTVVAVDESAVLLRCEAEAGNPRRLRRVRWYRDSVPVNETREQDLLLEYLQRSSAGNYSCQAENDAGWSPMSESKSLVVLYPPGPAAMTQKEPQALKGKPVTLMCHVNDTGLPATGAFRWEHGTTVLNVTGDTYQTEPITTATQGNYSCAAVNQVGIGPTAHRLLDAYAAPSFLRALPETGGTLRNSTSVALECIVECDPLCDISWFRNNVSLADSPFFQVTNVAQPESGGRFHSISSVLSWNMSQVPPVSFDYNTFMCQSSANDVGQPVSSTMVFRIEYPPEKLELSARQVVILEGELPRELKCSASAHPHAEYHWQLGALTVARGPMLVFNTTASRTMAGNYTCIVSNRHGRAKAAVVVIVRHRPHCIVVKEQDNSGNVVLRCEAQAVPPVVQFTWLRHNRTVQEDRGARSELHINDKNPDALAAYSCIAANMVGPSESCQLKLTRLPSPAGWVQLLLKEENLIIVAGIAGGVIIIIVLLIVIVSIVVIRKRMHCTKPQLDSGEKANGEIGRDTPQGKLSFLTDAKADGSPLLAEEFSSDDGRRSATQLVRHGTLALG